MKDNINDTDLFLVPEWLVGPAQQVGNAVKQRADEWAIAWQDRRTFPTVSLVSPGPLPPLLYNTSDHSPQEPRARLFANLDFVAEILKVLEYRDIKTVVMAYEAHVGGTAWGSFEGLLFERWPNGFEPTRLRLERIVPHLPVLGSTLVMDHDNVERPAAMVIEQQISATLENWGAADGGLLAVRIEHALTEMARSNADSLRERIVASMLRLLPTVTRLRNREAMTAERLYESLSAIEAEELDELTGCTRKALVSEIYAIDREL